MTALFCIAAVPYLPLLSPRCRSESEGFRGWGRQAAGEAAANQKAAGQFEAQHLANQGTDQPSQETSELSKLSAY